MAVPTRLAPDCHDTGGPQHTESQATDHHINIETVALLGGKNIKHYY